MNDIAKPKNISEENWLKFIETMKEGERILKEYCNKITKGK